MGMARATMNSSSRRDRAGREAEILAAAKRLLAEEGFAAFGINAIAKRAGCDKQLIYRYYGGLDGLVDAVATELGSMFQRLMVEPDPSASKDYADFVAHWLIALLDAFRRSDLLLRLAAWEVFEPTDVTRRLAKARGRILGDWIKQRRGKLSPPVGTDAAAINVVLIAAVQHLALSARSVGGFGGVALSGDTDWERIEHVLKLMVRSCYSAEVLRPSMDPVV